MDRTGAPSRASTPNTINAGADSLAGAAMPSMPLLRGPLPFTQREYESLPAEKRSPEMDFLILGKFPSLQKAPWPPMQLPQDFNDAVAKCIELGEWDALRFLWDASGIDPNRAIVSVRQADISCSFLQKMREACGLYPGLQSALSFSDLDTETERELARLIDQGNVNELGVGDPYSPGQISCDFLAPVLGKVTGTLSLACINLNAANELAFAESLANSGSLTCLHLHELVFQEGQGASFVDGMRHNHSIREMYVQLTSLPAGTQVSGYTLLLAQNSGLESLTIVRHGTDFEGNTHLEMDAVFAGLKTNKTLQELKFINSLNPKGMLSDIANLKYVLENNSSLKTLELELRLANPEAYRSVTESFAKNTSLTRFSLGGLKDQDPAMIHAVNDRLARNKARNNLEMMRLAGMAFDPDNKTGFADPGSVIARDIVANSSTMAEFAETMAAIELSIKELDKPSTPLPPAPAAGGTTMTTAATSTTITTTTTTATNTTTGSNQPKPAAS